MSKYVGQILPRVDGIGHVTGATTYVDDINLPGMLHIKVLHSPVHKGQIKTLDVTAAENMPGVAGTLTFKDIPGDNAYNGGGDQPVFVEENIRYKGERIAAVAAVDEDTALEAIEKIKLEIEEQTPVFDPLEAMKPGAPLVSPGGNILEFNSGNYRKIRKGDVEKAFDAADEIVTQTYTEKMHDHAAMEPHVSVAYLDANQRLNIHTVSQARNFHLGQLAGVLSLPFSRLKLVGGTVGGGFGGKNDIHCDHVAGLMALKLHKPVKYRMTRKEDLLYSSKRGAEIFEYKSGVMKDGRVVAHKIKAIHDMGAYNTMGSTCIDKQTQLVTGPYNVPNVWHDGYAIYTNKPVASSMRGFAILNVTFPSEMQMNRLAEAIGMDPWEIRFINAWRNGDTGPTMWKVQAAGLIETLKRAAEIGGIELPDHLKAMHSAGRD